MKIPNFAVGFAVFAVLALAVAVGCSVPVEGVPEDDGGGGGDDGSTTVDDDVTDDTDPDDVDDDDDVTPPSIGRGWGSS